VKRSAPAAQAWIARNRIVRSGLVTTAVKRGVNAQGLEMLRVYCRDAELFVGNAAGGLLYGKRIIGSHPQGCLPARPRRSQRT
jgi:hypothetical protein